MSLDFSHIKTVFLKNKANNREIFLKECTKKLEAYFDKFIESLKVELSDKNIINLINIENIDKDNPEKGLKLTFHRDNNHIGEMCCFFVNKVCKHQDLIKMWKERTIKEFGCAIVGHKNTERRKKIEKGFDIQKDVTSYTVYLVKGDDDYYDYIFNLLRNNERYLTEMKYGHNKIRCLSHFIQFCRKLREKLLNQ